MSFAPPSLAEIVRALYGVWLILIRDARAVSLLDTSVQGFWTSFFAAALALPAHMLMFLLNPVITDGLDPVGMVKLLEIYVIMVLAYPFAISFMLVVFDREANFVDYVVAYNWAGLPIAYLAALLTLATAGGVLPDGLAFLLSCLTYGTILYLLWRVARSTLDITEFQAVCVVVFEIVVTAALFEILLGFGGW